MGRSAIYNGAEQRVLLLQTTSEQLDIAASDVNVVSMSTDKRRTQNADGATQELFIHYQTAVQDNTY